MISKASFIKSSLVCISLMVILFIIFPVSFIYFISSKNAHVQETYVSPEEIKEAVNTYKYIKKEIFDTMYKIDLKLEEKDILVLFKTTSKATPWLDFDFGMDHNVLMLAGTLDINRLFESRYVNASCLIIPDRYNSIDSCQIGNLTLSGNVVKSLISLALNTFFDKSINDVFLQVIRNVDIESKNVHISAVKDIDFKEQSKIGLQAMISTAKTFRTDSTSTLDPDIIDSYIAFMSSDANIIGKRDVSLSEVFNSAFSYASQRSEYSDPAIENEYAIWSVAIAFANPRFSELLKIETTSLKHLTRALTSKNVVINSRRDLTLHFLYSAILERVGNESFSNNIGEIKELLDANEGGSGFDTSDLAADLSGAKFSNFVSSSKSNALWSQRILASNLSEEVFFPNISSYPGAIKADDFDDFVGESKNEMLSELITTLQKDVSTLSLYQVDEINVHKTAFNVARHKSNSTAEVTVQRIPWANQGVWLSADTHIHTKHSDGSHTINEVAEKAIEYGCNVIAITDHADGNLSAGTLEYFKEIDNINRQFPYLSVISGLEWNLPPYKGREHASLLFPDGESTALTAAEFRSMFDDYGNSIDPLTSVSESLAWLESKFSSYSTLPVVLYNHPSRKSVSREEVRKNLESWSQKNQIFVGFSGAPGHQRMPVDRIGSYTYDFKTSDRWDPTVSENGGTWDTLLADGVILWGARAPSDFHSNRGDYWPCQFSETRVYARDNSINSVIEALRRGAFFGSHGKVVKDLSFELELPSHERPVIMGEAVSVKEGSQLVVNLEISLNDKNWKGKTAKLEQVELVVNSNGKVTNHIYDTEGYRRGNRIAISVSDLTVTGDMVIRWRGRSMQEINGDYMFYTNPIILRTLSD